MTANNDKLIAAASKVLTYLNMQVLGPQNVPVIPLDGTTVANKDIVLDDYLPHVEEGKKPEELVNLNLFSAPKQSALRVIHAQGQEWISKQYKTFSEPGVAHYKLDINDPLVAAKGMANIALLIKHVAERNNKGGKEFSVGDLKFIGITAFYIAEKLFQQPITRESLRSALTPDIRDDGEVAVQLFKEFTDFIRAVDDPDYEKKSAKQHSGIYALIPESVVFVKVRNKIRNENMLAMGLNAAALGPYLDNELFPALKTAKPQPAAPDPTTADAAEASPPQTPTRGIETVQQDDLGEKIAGLIKARARYQEWQESIDKLREQRTALNALIEDQVQQQGQLQQQIRVDQKEVASPATILQATKVKLAKQIEENSTKLGSLQKQDEKSRKKMAKLEKNIQTIDFELISLKDSIDKQSDLLETSLQEKQAELQEKIKLAEDTVGVLRAEKDVLSHELDASPHKAHELSKHYKEVNAKFLQQLQILTALGASAEAHERNLNGIQKALPAARGYEFSQQVESLVASIKQTKEVVESHVQALPAPELTTLSEKTERFKKSMKAVRGEVTELKQKIIDAYRLPAKRSDRPQLHTDFQIAVGKIDDLRKQYDGLRKEYLSQPEKIKGQLKDYLKSAPQKEQQWVDLEHCLKACDALDAYLVDRKNSASYRYHIFSRSDDVVRDKAVSDLQNKLLDTVEDFQKNKDSLKQELLKVIRDYNPRKFGDYEKSLQFHALKIAHDLGFKDVVKDIDPKIIERFNKVVEEKHIAVRGLGK